VLKESSAVGPSVVLSKSLAGYVRRIIFGVIIALRRSAKSTVEGGRRGRKRKHHLEGDATKS
jgi:hypothetical protein